MNGLPFTSKSRGPILSEDVGEIGTPKPETVTGTHVRLAPAQLNPVDALLFVKRIGGSGLSLGDGD
jgi:hypothetical protein